MAPSNHWTGFCRYLDEGDFLKRDDIDGHIGWPITKSELDLFRAEAAEILGVGLLGEKKIDPFVKEVEFALSPPVRFGEKYLGLFERSKFANLCLNSNVVNLRAKSGRVSVVINGKKVGEVTGCKPSVGSIALQSEGSEVHFRRIMLKPLE